MSNTARNPITGHWLKSKPATDKYRDGFDAIFGKKDRPDPEEPEEEPEQASENK